ncbi:hypothetical protein R3P38DRAFT_2982688 [Favolaschia claudopus]|uniref:Cyclochlorotine biosynthesis protein O n=1 Tax=Favolaschia claudopus TaxID=2862362 RepID=A0AAW0AY11_9AGAR
MSKPSRDYSLLPTDDEGYEKKRGSALLKLPLSAILLVSLLCNIFLVLCYWISPPTQQALPETVYSPAMQAIEYMPVKFHRGLEDDIPIYERPPSAEVDEAWEQLYEYAASRVTKSEVGPMLNATWPILDEPGNYVIALDVFHQLHCLDMLRQRIHPGHNYPRMSTKHLRHCIGAIRQSLMCHADITPIVWQWSPRYQEAEQRDDVVHTCRDFDRIKAWAKERSMGSLPDLTVYLEG